MRLRDLLTRRRVGGKATVGSPWWYPASLTVAAGQLATDGGVCAGFVVVDYPAEVGLGWLEPLLTHPGWLDVALHIEPIPPTVAAARLRRQRARLESGRRRDAALGRLDDPEQEAAAADAQQLAYQVARGATRLFHLGLYVTVWAPSSAELAGEVAALRAVAEGMLLRLAPLTYRQLQGWITTRPFGVDAIRRTRTMDTDALAAAFPFTSPDLPDSSPAASQRTSAGVLYGANAASSGLVIWDRFAQDNHNSVILARSGAGKSYLAKLEALRSLYQGVEVMVIDPEDEYTRMAEALGGTCLRLGAPDVRLNPFDLPIRRGRDGGETVMRRALFTHTVLEILLGGLEAAEHAAADRAVLAAYRAAGISADERTHTRPAPLLADLAQALTREADVVGHGLAARLAPFVEGSFSTLFAGPSTHRVDGHLVVFSLRELPEELKAIAMLLVLDAMWRRIDNPENLRPRLVVVDEAWLLMQQPAGARFLFRMAKASRKRWAGLSVVSQDPADLLGSELGQAVVANSSTQVLLRQASQASQAITNAFRLSAGEREFLLTAGQGQGLLCASGAGGAGHARVALHAVASAAEHELITTNPAETTTWHRDTHSGIPADGTEEDVY